MNFILKLLILLIFELLTHGFLYGLNQNGFFIRN